MDVEKLRKRHNWTREDLASKLGVSYMTIYRWEKGKSKPQRSHIKRMSEIFTKEAKR